MTDKVMEDVEKEYGMIDNVTYLLKNIWKWDKTLFLLGIISIPANVFIPLIGIYIPKVLIDSVANNIGLSQLIIKIGIPILTIVFLTITTNSSAAVIEGRAGINRMKYMELLALKAIDTDYENIDGAMGQERLMKASMSLSSNHSATQVIVETSVDFFTNVLGFILYAGIISTLHPIIVGFIILSSIINYFVGKYVNNYEYKNKDNLAPIEKRLKYIRDKTGEFKSAKDMRLYNMSSWFKNMYGIYLDKRIYFQKKDIFRRYFANIIDGILILLRDGIAYGFLIYSVLYKDMLVGDFILYFGAIAGFSMWLSGIVTNLNSLNAISLNTSDLRDYLEMEDGMNRGKGIELPNVNKMPCDVELKGVYYKYPGAEDYTIKNINLYIKKGEKLALVGVNGAGKTTLVKLISGLYTPTKGTIYINGKRSTDYNRDEYYSLFSVVFQDNHILPVSIERNISSQLKEDIDYKKMEKVLSLSGLMDKVKSLPRGKDTLLVKSIYEEAVEFSGGEIQKLMLSRALYKGGTIIILDEPTAALDPIAENEIYRKYNELTKEHTSIFISHRLSSTRFCNRVVFLEDGQIIEEGSHKNLMAGDGKYKEMYDMQSHYYKDNIGAGIND